MNSKLSLKSVLCVLIVSLSACKKNEDPNNPISNTPPTPPSQGTQTPESDEEGGISAGGGGTLPANPIGAYKVVEIVDSAKRTLKLYFNHQRKYNPSFPELEDYKYFFGDNNLTTVLEKTEIEILEDRPCKNKFGKDVDASIHASRPNTICLSAFRIAPKLIEENAQKEILALLIHELSHFLGSNEKEAVSLQKMTAYHLQNLTNQDLGLAELRLWDAPHQVEKIFRSKQTIHDLISKENLPSIRAELELVSKGLSDFEKFFEQQPLSFTDFTLNEYERLLHSKLRLARIFVESIDPTYRFQLDSKEIYEKCFETGESFTALEISKSCSVFYLDKENIYSNYQIHKIKSTADLKPFLSDVFLYVHNLSQHVRSIAFNLSPIYFHLPNFENTLDHWKKFIGNYQIIDKQCQSDWPKNYNGFQRLEHIEIGLGTSNYPLENEQTITLTEKEPNMSSTHHLKNGGGQYNSMKVFGDHNSATMTDEKGTRWYDRQGHGYSKTTKIIESINEEIFMTMVLDSMSYDHRGYNSAGYQCRFKLRQL